MNKCYRIIFMYIFFMYLETILPEVVYGQVSTEKMISHT